MQVSIKNLDVEMELKNSGMELTVYDTDGVTHLGDLVINKAKLIWCPGRVKRENGYPISWQKFIEYMESE